MTEEIIAAAGEYVAGLMSEEERAAFERRTTADSEVRRAVADWRRRLLPLDEAAPEIAPSAMLWPAIEQAIGTAPAIAKMGIAGRLAGAWADARIMRAAWLGAMAIVLVLAASLLMQPFRQPVAPAVVAVLNPPDSQVAAVVVEAFADGRIRVVPLRPIEVPAGRTLQLWTLWDRATGPRSIGLMADFRGRDYWTSGLPVPVPDQLYEITLEPAGGSPTGRPTGPVLFIGRGTRPL